MITQLRDARLRRRRDRRLAVPRRRLAARLADRGAAREPRLGGQAARAGRRLLSVRSPALPADPAPRCLLGTLPLELVLHTRRVRPLAAAARRSLAPVVVVFGGWDVLAIRAALVALRPGLPRRRHAARPAAARGAAVLPRRSRPAPCSPSRRCGRGGRLADRRRGDAVSYTLVAVVHRRVLARGRCSTVVVRCGTTLLLRRKGVLDGVRDRAGRSSWS